VRARRQRSGIAARRMAFESLEQRHLLTASLSAANVLVLYNTANSDGAQIANFYAQVHPGVQLQPISGVDPNSEDISADDYLATIRPQVLAALTPSIDVIVTTKGLPLRIHVTEDAPTAVFPTLPTYVDPSGTVRQILNWQAYSSLESELTSINLVSTWLMMGDQSYQINFSGNPYYLSTGHFDSSTTGTYLTSRLDGYSVIDVIGEISRAQNAFVGPNNSSTGPYYFLVDNDPSLNYAPTMANLVNNVLTPAGLPVVYDNTSAFVGSAPGPIIGYDSHGVHQASTPSNYIVGGISAALANGAVFNSWESYNAYSFKVGGYTGNQGQLAQWIAKGGTAAVGNVQEPGASPSRVANEDQLFKMLLSGMTWAEAGWSSFRQLGYVNTVVGDPLMTWVRLPQATTATVVGRQIFYNNSTWDGQDAAPGTADDSAIAIDKMAYRGGSVPATFANVSSYANGINGIMIDILGTHGTISANDFGFKIGNNNSPSLWQSAPPPTVVTVRPGAGTGGSDRIELIWPDGAIKGSWLQVQVNGNDSAGGMNQDTGLAATDVFYVGSAVGDTGFGDSFGFSVNSVDIASVRNNPHGNGNQATIIDVNDINRDGLVNSIDEVLLRNSQTSRVTRPIFLNVSGGPLAPIATASIAQVTTGNDSGGPELTVLAKSCFDSAPMTPATSSPPSALSVTAAAQAHLFDRTYFQQLGEQPLENADALSFSSEPALDPLEQILSSRLGLRVTFHRS
jgi:uncharacterized protein (TIGR03790 family)